MNVGHIIGVLLCLAAKEAIRPLINLPSLLKICNGSL